MEALEHQTHSPTMLQQPAPVGQAELDTGHGELAEVGSIPAIRCNRVDLPEPLGPQSATTAPGSMVIETSWTATMRAAPEPKALCRPLAWIDAPAVPVWSTPTTIRLVSPSLAEAVKGKTMECTDCQHLQIFGPFGSRVVAYATDSARTTWRRSPVDKHLYVALPIVRPWLRCHSALRR
jgi:hypothetical protein